MIIIMPTKPLKKCKIATCLERVKHGKISYCDTHARQYYREHSNPNPFYKDPLWIKTSKIKLKRNPLCERCLQHDVVRKSEEVDHIVPISQGGPKFAMTNLQALCKSCHSQKTQTDKKLYKTA